MKIYLMGGHGIEKPVDFNGVEIKAGDLLTSDFFDTIFYEEFYKKHFSSKTSEDIKEIKNKATYLVKWNEKGFFYGEGIEMELYLHDFRFKYTKIVSK